MARVPRIGAQSLLASLLAVTIVWQAARAESGNSLVLAIKATFLYKFPLYVTWPERALPASGSEFNLCIVGDEPFAMLVERAAAGQSVAGHRMSVLRLRAPASAGQCAVLSIATDDPGLVRPFLAAVDGLPVLTVTDGMRAPDAKGMINFVIAGDRVRFQIDEARAAHGGLAISSKLLSLALPAGSAP